MNCMDCPLIKDEMERRLNSYGYEDIMKYPEFKEDIMNEICCSCFCDKYGTKIFWTNTDGCDNYPSVSIKKKVRGKRRRTKRERESKYRKHLKKLESLPYEPCGASYKDEIYIPGEGYVKNPKPYYARSYKGRDYTELKKMANRRVRRRNNVLYHGNQYRKVFDLWNEYI